MQFTDLPGLGQPLEGGTFAGLTTAPDGKVLAVVLMADKPATRLDWEAACAWAQTVGGTLPTRPVAAMLFANAKAQFEEAWHWTADEFGGSYAWGQSFNYGTQGTLHKSCEGRARAVRLLDEALALWPRDCRLCAHYRPHAPNCASVIRCEDSSA